MNESVCSIDSSQRFERDQRSDSKGVAVFKVLHKPLILRKFCRNSRRVQEEVGSSGLAEPGTEEQVSAAVSRFS